MGKTAKKALGYAFTWLTKGEADKFEEVRKAIKETVAEAVAEAVRKAVRGLVEEQLAKLGVTEKTLGEAYKWIAKIGAEEEKKAKA